MLLKDWMNKNDIRPYRFAKKAGIDKATFYKILAGTADMSKNVALKIETFTEGEVSRMEALWPELYQEKAPDGSVQMTFAPRGISERGKVN